MGSLYSQPITREYGGAGLGGLLVRLLSIGLGWVVPFFVAYATSYLWMKEIQYWEQADVVFMNKAVTVVSGYDHSGPTGSAAQLQQLKWVSIPSAEQYLGEALHPLRLSSYSEDVNQDDKADRMHIDLKVPLPPSFRVHSVDAVLFFQFKLSQMIDLEMESIGHVTHTSPMPIRDITIDGDLRFQQRGVLKLDPYTDYDAIYNVSRFDVGTIKSPLDLSIRKIVSDYSQRNESTTIDTHGETLTPDTSPLDVPRYLSVSLLLRNVAQPITHSSDLPQILKFALVQYMALWYVFTSLAQFLSRVLVQTGLVNSVRRCRDLDALKNERKRIY